MQVSLLPAAASGQSPQKVLQAARQFEAILLNSVLESLQKSFVELPGTKDDPSTSQYQHLGTQALAGAMAKAGGIGIAPMIERNLLKSQGEALQSISKVSPSWTDMELQEKVQTK